jgi:hypothetical protein
MSSFFLDHRGWLSVGLFLVGLSTLIAAFFVSWLHAGYASAGNIRSEKFFDFLKTSLFQIGLVFAGAGASLTTFFFQQDYQRDIEKLTHRQEAIAKLDYRLALTIKQFNANISPYSDLLDRGGPFLTVSEITKWNETWKKVLSGGDKLSEVLGEFFDTSLDTDFASVPAAFKFFPEFEKDQYLSRTISPQLQAAIAEDDIVISGRFKKFLDAYGPINDDTSTKNTKKPISMNDIIKKDNARFLVVTSEMLQNFDYVRRAALRQMGRFCILQDAVSRNTLSAALMDKLEFLYDESAVGWLNKESSLLSQFNFGSKRCSEQIVLSSQTEPQKK